MKLNSIQTERTLSQFEAEVLPDNHPALRQLSGIFGDHTFFLDGSGLNVLEPAKTIAQYGRYENVAEQPLCIAGGFTASDNREMALRPQRPGPRERATLSVRTSPQPQRQVKR